MINARVETRTVAQTLAAEVQAVADRGAAAWIGYRVPMAARTATELRFMDGRARCRLEPPADLVVLARVEAKLLVELRALGADCDVDAAGMPLIWLEGVHPDQSVAWLASLVAGGGAGRRPDRLATAALAAIGQHASPAATGALLTLARDGQAALRGQALVWLARLASHQAAPAITDAIARDPELAVKRQAVIALGRLPRDEGVPLLIGVARTHASPQIRSQAMQALGQSNDPRALAFFEQVLGR